MVEGGNLSTLLAEAIVHHRAGRLVEAGGIYAAILNADPGHADALHLQGVVANQEGRCDDALVLIEKAIAINPLAPEYHNSLGSVRQALGDEGEALRLYVYAIQLQGDYLEPYRNILRLRPDATDVRWNFACALHRRGSIAEAMVQYEQVVSSCPENAVAFNNLGCAQREVGRFDEAVVNLQRAVALQPDYAEAYNNLGLALHDRYLLEEAVASYVVALALRPDFPDFYCNLARSLHHLGRHEEAIAQYREALRIAPNLAKAYYSWGCVLDVLGRYPEAIEQFAEAIRIEPGYVEAHVNRAVLLLLSGRYLEGWAEYEWRLVRPDWRGANSYYPSLPRWDGALVVGKKILVQAEQGFGDTLQLARFLPSVKARCGQLIVEAQPELHALLEMVPEIDTVIAREGGRVPEADFAIPIMSLPALFATTLESIPLVFPYLHAPVVRMEKWRKLIVREGFRVGITWSGNPAYPGNEERSCDLNQFAVLATLPGVRLFSLQKGPPAEQLIATSPGMEIVDIAPELHDFADTAAAIMQLDLVISVDTALVHLVGALGRPIWTLRYHIPYWVWGVSGASTPWYPSMRVFRQRTPGDWDGVFCQVAEELGHLLSSEAGGQGEMF